MDKSTVPHTEAKKRVNTFIAFSEEMYCAAAVEYNIEVKMKLQWKWNEK